MATFQVDVGNATYEVDAPDESSAWKMANKFHASQPTATQEGRAANPTIAGLPMRGAITALQAPLMGFGDELFGGLSAAGRSVANLVGAGNGQSFGQNYRDSRDYVRGITDQFKQDAPITSMATGLAASAPLMMIGGPTGPAATAMSGMARMGQAGKVGALYGALSGAGDSTAESPLGVLADTGKGAAISGGLALGGQGAANILGAAGSNIAQRISDTSAADKARLMLADMLAKDTRIPNAPVETRLAALGPKATITDATPAGSNIRQMADTLSVLPGDAKKMAEALITQRQSGRAGRLVTAADNALGTSGKGYTDTLNALDAAKKAAAQPFYQKLEGVSIRADSDLAGVLKAAESAHGGAEKLAVLKQELPIDLSKIKAGDDVPLNALDKVKQALWDLAESSKGEFGKPTSLSNAYNDLRVKLTGKMDELSPHDVNGSIYKQARDAYGGKAMLEAAVREGRGAMKEDALAIADTTKGMGASELEAFRIGALQAIRDKVGTQSGQSALLEMWKNPGISDKLKQIFGNNYEKFASAVANEKQLKLIESTGRGSQTAARLFGSGEMDALNAAASVGQAAAGAAHGNPLPIVGAIAKLINRVQTPESTRNELARLLLTPGAQKDLAGLPALIARTNAQRGALATGAGLLSPQVQGALFQNR